MAKDAGETGIGAGFITRRHFVRWCALLVFGCSHFTLWLYVVLGAEPCCAQLCLFNAWHKPNINSRVTVHCNSGPHSVSAVRRVYGSASGTPRRNGISRRLVRNPVDTESTATHSKHDSRNADQHCGGW